MATTGWVWLCKVDECVSIVLVSLHVAVLNEPLNLLLDHLLGRNEHVLENLDQFRLKGSVGKTLPHFHDLHYGLLRGGRQEREKGMEGEGERETEGGGRGERGREERREGDWISTAIKYHFAAVSVITKQDNYYYCVSRIKLVLVYLTCTRSTLRATMLSLSSSLVFSVVNWRRPIRLIFPRF